MRFAGSAGDALPHAAGSGCDFDGVLCLSDTFHPHRATGMCSAVAATVRTLRHACYWPRADMAVFGSLRPGITSAY